MEDCRKSDCLCLLHYYEIALNFTLHFSPERVFV